MSTVSSLSSLGALASLQSTSGTRSIVSTDSDDAGVSAVKSKSSSVILAVEKALTQLGIGSTDSSTTSTSDSINSTSTQDTQQAAQAFLQSLLAALHQADGSSPNPPPSGEGGMEASGAPAYTKDELTSMASQIGSTDSKRSELMTKLAANFDQADTNGDGMIDAKEAMAFDLANSTSSSTSAYQGGGNLEADIQALIQQLTSSNSSDSSSSSSTTDLQQSFQNLLSALNGSNNSSVATLENFLLALANNLQGSASTGNVVNDKA
jgi:hypothetical protein